VTFLSIQTGYLVLGQVKIRYTIGRPEIDNALESSVGEGFHVAEWRISLLLLSKYVINVSKDTHRFIPSSLLLLLSE
jgi:hypothetical protein